MDTYDEEKQLDAALRASLKESQPTPHDQPVKRGRGRPKSRSVKVKSEELRCKEDEPQNPKMKQKKTVIRLGEPLQRKFPSGNGGKQLVKRQGPTIPASESSNDAPKTEEFVDYLCLRKSVSSKDDGKPLSEDEDSLVIAESGDSSGPEDGVDFKVFEFNETLTEEYDCTIDNPIPQTLSKHENSVKKKKLTQNYYNAKLQTSFDNTENSALASATIFRPTGEEFKNFHAYLEKMTPQLVSNGMCKVVPPLAWRTPHVLQEDLRFNVKTQEVHRLCHRSGPSTTVLKQIKAHIFFDLGFEWKGSPQIGTTFVDLTRFSWLMKKHGGLQVVIDKNKWSKLGDALGIPGVAERNEQLEDVYCKYLLSYDLLSDHQKESLRVDEIDEISEVENACKKKMTLQALRRHDTNSRVAKFPPDGVASATSLELEFWNLVCRAEEHFVAMQGTESTMTHGSGFPAYEPRHIAQSDWNLTNLRHLPDGIMGFLPNVNFVTQPRLELNSLFSVTGWHVEPHFLPLISYNHFSYPRIWYACPASQSGRFLSVLHDIVPRLVNGNHILNPNCVLVPPAEFAAKEITLCRAVQKPGEFILTAPMSYICNFSLGLNVNEAVNFATEEWLHYCPSSLKLYQAWNLKPSLNIPQIISDVIERHDSLNERTLRAAEPHLTTLIKQELKVRKECHLPRSSSVQNSGDMYCAQCQTICHLSYVRSGCVSKDASVLKMKRKCSKNRSIAPIVYCLHHSKHASSGMLVCNVSETSLKHMLSTLEKRLYPKRSVVHPVQSLARSVCRHTSSVVASKPKPVQDDLSGSDVTNDKSNSPVCPASPAENEVGDAHNGIRLDIPSNPLEMDTSSPSNAFQKDTSNPSNPLPKDTSSTTHSFLKVISNPSNPFQIDTSSPSHSFHKVGSSTGTTLAKPIPIKPTPPPIIPSLLVHPQQFPLLLPPPETPALWESYQPDLENSSYEKHS